MSRRHFTCLARDITVMPDKNKINSNLRDRHTGSAYSRNDGLQRGEKNFSPRILFFKIVERERAAVVSEYVVFVVFVFFYRVVY